MALLMIHVSACEFVRAYGIAPLDDTLDRLERLNVDPFWAHLRFKGEASICASLAQDNTSFRQNLAATLFYQTIGRLSRLGLSP